MTALGNGVASTIGVGIMGQTDPAGHVIGIDGPMGATSSVKPIAPYIGLVGSRGCVPNQGGGAVQIMTRSRHIAMDRISAVQLVYSAYYTKNSPTGETTPGGSLAFTASIEYPVGVTVTQVTFGNMAQGVCAALANITSDMLNLPVAIPKGAVFYVRTWQAGLGGATSVYHYGGPNASGAVPLNGEWCAGGSTTPDLTMSLTNSNNQYGGGITFRPTAIVGYTTRPSIGIIGDSRTWSLGGPSASSSYDNVGNAFACSGSTERHIGKRFAFMNCAGTNEHLQGWALNNGTIVIAGRLALLNKYCSHILIQHGIVDLISTGQNRTSAQALADLQTVGGMFPGKILIGCTVEPRTTSTDSWATTTNQTADTNNAQRVAYNDALRGGLPAPFAGVVEIADQFESARDSGLWKVNGAASGYTSDGLHATPLAQWMLNEPSNAAEWMRSLIEA